MPSELLSPWREFLHALDRSLDEPVQLHCVGGFVLTACYKMPRVTHDLDFCEIIPPGKARLLLELAGETGPLAKEHGIHLHPARVGQLPEDYLTRLVQVFPDEFRQLQIFALDPYDLALSKLERNAERDRDDVHWLARSIPLDPEVLRQRYQQEFRPYLGNPAREDLTLRLWLEDLFPQS